MFDYDDEIEYMDFSEEGFREVQQCLDRFVKVNYETALGLLYRMKLTPEDITLYKGKVLDIIRHNPPLESVPRYFQDGREDYLWYSDFYDDITKEVYQRYRTFIAPAVEITSANYTEELVKIDLPYFRELVDLVSLEKLCMLHEVNQPLQKDETDTKEEPDIVPDGDSDMEDIVDENCFLMIASNSSIVRKIGLVSSCRYLTPANGSFLNHSLAIAIFVIFLKHFI